MTPADRARLLASMNAGRLVILCGAGLSMAPPSNLPSAWRVAGMCFDEYRLTIDPLIDLALRDDLEALAEHFVGLNALKAVFIEHLVPWKEFERPPNPGHAAVADFLIAFSALAAATLLFSNEQAGESRVTQSAQLTDYRTTRFPEF